MSSRSLSILVAAVLAMVALLYWQSSDDAPEDVAQPILPGLDEMLNDVERLTVIGAGNEATATLVRGDRHWTLAERDGYRADVGRIRKNLIALADARIVERKTADPMLHSRLGVEDVANAAATGKEFVIETPSDSFRLIVGKRGARGGMSYVRHPDADQTFLVSADLDPGDDTTDWLRRDLLDIAADRVYGVTITHPDGAVLRIEKTTREAADFTVVDMPEGRELQYATILDSLAGVLTGLTLDDVQADADEADDAQAVRARFETFDGLVIDATVREPGDGPRVLFRVRAEQALAERFLPPSNADDDSSAISSFAAVGEEAERLNEVLNGWVYTLPSFKTDQLVRRLDDIMKPVE